MPSAESTRYENQYYRDLGPMMRYNREVEQNTGVHSKPPKATDRTSPRFWPEAEDQRQANAMHLGELPDGSKHTSGPFETPLTYKQEVGYREWKKTNAPQDSGKDYDLRGAFLAGTRPGADGHWPDTYKKPNHPTFSDESIYANLGNPGHWNGDTFVKPDTKTHKQTPTFLNRTRQSIEGGADAIKQWLNSNETWKKITSPQSPPRFNTGHPSPEGAKGNDELRNQMFKGLMSDQNSWMGMGAGAGAMVKSLRGVEGAGTEILNRLKLRGITPEALDKMLMRRAVDWDARHEIQSEYRAATDLSATPTPWPPMHNSGVWLALHGHGLRGNAAHPGMGSRSNMIPHPSDPAASAVARMREEDFQTELANDRAMESVTRGNAAEGAVTRQAGRMMDRIGRYADDPEFNLKKSEYGPPGVVTDAQYYAEKPIRAEHLPSIDGERQADNSGMRQAYQDRVDRYNFGRTGRKEQ